MRPTAAAGLLSSSTNTVTNALVTAAKNLGYSSTDCNTVKTHLVNRGSTVAATCP